MLAGEECWDGVDECFNEAVQSAKEGGLHMPLSEGQTDRLTDVLFRVANERPRETSM